MPAVRQLALTLGPVVIVAGSYWLCYSPASGSIDETGIAAHAPAAASRPAPAMPAPALEAACRERAEKLAGKLQPGCRILVRTPFILAGDIPESRLDRLHRDLIVPISRALQTCYFDRQPTEPVTILIFSNDRVYRKHARMLDGRAHASYSGYYQRDDRRIVMNIATGYGTLAHELTHALAHFDCPQLPQWFDEGFASLHEECRVSKDGLKLDGRSNWRLAYLLPALKTGRLPSLDSLMSRQTIRGENEAVLYAQSRYFCLYLQQRGLLAHFYRKLKATIHTDPTGRTALRELLHADSLDGVEQDFRKWLRTLRPAGPAKR